MNTTKGDKLKGSGSGRADISPDPDTVENNTESPNIIPSDTILAEKDEVKIAEERLREKKKDEAKGEEVKVKGKR